MNTATRCTKPLSFSGYRRHALQVAAARSEGNDTGFFGNPVQAAFQSTPEGQFLAVNDPFARMLGYECGQQVVASYPRIAEQLYVHPEEREKFKALLDEHGFARDLSFEAYRRDGSRFWLRFHAWAVHDEAGNTLFYEGFVEDGTATRSLGRTNAELENFAHALCHDLTEPLRTISLYLQTLRREITGVVGREAARDLQHALDGTRRMEGLIRELLGYATAGGLETAVGFVDTKAVIGEVIEGLEASIGEAGARIEIGPLAPVCCMPKAQLFQLFQNLLQNALKFRDQQPLVVRITATPEKDGWTRFTVADNGRGVPEEDRERIFEPLTRGARSPYFVQGSGLGLAICRRIVTNHGGSIWVESNGTSGALFHVLLRSGGR